VRQGWNLPALPGARPCIGIAGLLPGVPHVCVVPLISSTQAGAAQLCSGEVRNCISCRSSSSSISDGGL